MALFRRRRCSRRRSALPREWPPTLYPRFAERARARRVAEPRVGSRTSLLKRIPRGLVVREQVAQHAPTEHECVERNALIHTVEQGGKVEFGRELQRRKS